MLGIGLYANPNCSELVLDLAARGMGHSFGTGKHGFDTYTCSVPLGLIDAFRLYDRPGLPWVAVTWQGGVVWEGRVEDFAIVDGGIKLTAFGAWRALYDVPYTALWSTTDLRLWGQLTNNDRSDVYNERYQLDQFDRLYIAPRKGEDFGTTTSAKLGVWGFLIPDQSARQITLAEFDYAFLAPTNWRARLLRADSSWGTVGTPLTLTGSGVLQTGTQNATLTACDRLLLALDFDAADAEFTGETGDAYFEITNVRVRTLAGGGISANEIAQGLAEYVNGINPTQLSASTVLLDNPGLDMRDELYEDAWPADILDHLAGVGDGSAHLWETGVWEQRLLTFRQRANDRHWYVDASSIEIDRTLDTLRNSAYGVYQGVSGRTRRTSASTDSGSVARFGLTRREAVRANTTSSTDAENLRNLNRNDKATPRPQASLVFRELYDASGVRWPLFMARAWQTVTVRNLPPTLSVDIDRIRTFRLAETRYDADNDLLEVVPEGHPPRVDLLLARLAAGIGRND